MAAFSHKTNREENDSSSPETITLLVQENMELIENNILHDNDIEKNADKDDAILFHKQTNIRNSNVQINRRTSRDDQLIGEYRLPLNTKLKESSLIWKQSLAASVPILLTLVVGLTSGYSSTLIPELKEEAGPIPTDEETISWIASAAALPMAPGCLIVGWMLEKFGRKNSHYIVSLIFFIGWILITVAKNLFLIVTGRLLTGICIGLLGPLAAVFIGETTSPKHRGSFLAGISLAAAAGIFVVHVIGTFTSWRWTAGISSVFTALTAILLVFTPESPTWLISKNRLDDGAISFHWLRGFGEEAKAELKAIIDAKLAADGQPKTTLKTTLSDLTNSELLKPLFIMIVLFLTCEFSGVNAVAYYSIDIIEKSVGKDVDKYMIMLIIDVLRLTISIAACVICKEYGRRPICILSGVLTGSSLVALSLFLYLKPVNMSWFPLTCLMMYICAITIGIVPIPWVICGEIFPTKFRGLGTGISSSIAFLALFIVVKMAPFMLYDLGEVFTFLFYGLVLLIGSFILYFILPETNGKTLHEIEEQFVKTNRSNP